MRTVDLGIIKPKIITTGQSDEFFIPLLLFRGNMTIGRAQALWNLTLALKEAEVDTIAKACILSGEAKDLSHLCGRHAAVQNLQLRMFWTRLMQSPSVLDSEPNLEEYIRHVVRISRSYLLRLDHIPRESIWSRQPWRKARRTATIASNEPAPPSFWPFLTAEPTDEHTLLLAVDGAVPKTLPEHIRQDVCQDLVVAVLSGDVSIGNLQDATPKYIKQVFKQFPIKYGPLSLDMPAPWSRDDTRTLGELLAS